ncbi:deoxyguanosinetriphosphate triphosphohydrolase [Sphingomonas sp. SUN039]|uniref:deoxyguanosinetriphosphate triphosphohydrolase n=1 Tax=Sphingomonas sp. SUN039 TaxID=2937787 RepID=UPI00216478F7|nr:deoxyguanosinetriphosphate triphosphohydrolase [Sphingomonas sp. SUN039]UVO54463.1 deoxyguanosinetriphosphate triphosphohydrolase [Sphingomonas sp. SUN039]
MKPLAMLASDSALSRGRQHFEVTGETRGPRTAFQRDRDRIIHSISFRRLRHKTQVFVAPDGDHFRVRLTHSLEVAQIGRTIARALGLDEDLTEALCLAHDIGHPPFGHAGEDALKAAMQDVGGFDHNGHTLRVLSQIDSPYPRWRGLNLSWEALEGLAKHNGPVATPGWALAEVDAGFALDLTGQPSLEAQVAAVADDIAYDNHDIDDGLRAGLLDFDELAALPLVARGWAAVLRRYPDVPHRRLRAELIRQQIGTMVNDVIDETRARTAAAGVTSVADVRAASMALSGFSPTMAEEERALKAFMYAKLYHHPRQTEVADRAQELIAGLFAAYRDDPARLPEEWRESLPEADPARSRHIGDFIAGMTDRYAIARYREVVGDVEMPEGF